MEIDLSRRSLLPIIGVNECGKTTILHAIFAFDYANDQLNNGRHLQDTVNLYSSNAPAPRISAEIEFTRSDLKRALNVLARSPEWSRNSAVATYQRKRPKLDGAVTISRSLDTREYQLAIPRFYNKKLNDALARQILRRLPYILYFDDFTGSVDERVEIKTDGGEWIQILETLFKKTDPTFSAYDLPAKEERLRKSMLSKVKRKLEETLTREWRNFRLDDTDALTVSLDYESESGQGGERHYLKFEIVERDANEDEHYFFVRDRSKGFYWFFNFVMKLEFNPKVVDGGGPEAIYLLDEPGSYLHATAQEKLCAKLRSLSDSNHVIYCTHSHYLLNPDFIPLNCIRIAEKDASGDVTLVPIGEHAGRITERRSAFQPVIDALQVRPLHLDLLQEPALLVEGIVDYYAYTLFSERENTVIVPCVGAPSMKFYISLMIAWGLDYRALWDNDKAGREGYESAATHFGEREAAKSFRFLPKAGRTSKRIIQDLIDGADIRTFKEKLELPMNTSFDKVMAALFYAADRDDMLDSLSNRTVQAFEELDQHLWVRRGSPTD